MGVVRQPAAAILAIDPEISDWLIFLAIVESALALTPNSSSLQPAGCAPTTTPTAIPDHPTSFAHGRYQVEQFLGEGYKDKVYPLRPFG